MKLQSLQPKAMGLTSRLSYSTVRLECFTGDGTQSTGTGFFFRFAVDSASHVPAIVTNRHVVAGATSAPIAFHFAVAPGEARHSDFTAVSVGGFDRLCIGHPDPSVDLAIISIGEILRELGASGRKAFIEPLDMSLVPSGDELARVEALQDIVLIGYPNGIWDSVNNMPIFRRGTTATHLRHDYEGKPEFMIDAACFPGSSGSPV